MTRERLERHQAWIYPAAIVLGLTLALPAGWEAAAVVIVLQTLVELLGMTAYLRWVPTRLLPDSPLDR